MRHLISFPSTPSEMSYLFGARRVRASVLRPLGNAPPEKLKRLTLHLMEVKAAQCTWSSVPCSGRFVNMAMLLMWQQARMYPMVIVVNFFFEWEKETTACIPLTSYKHKSQRENASAYTSVSCFRYTDLFLMKQFLSSTHTRYLHSHKTAYCVLFLQEQSQLPATILLAQHKVRAAQLETQIEQQKQVVKPTNLFSTGIQMVSPILHFTHAKSVFLPWSVKAHNRIVHLLNDPFFYSNPNGSLKIYQKELGGRGNKLILHLVLSTLWCCKVFPIFFSVPIKTATTTHCWSFMSFECRGFFFF